MMTLLRAWMICLLLTASVSAADVAASARARLDWQPLPDLPDAIGVAGPFVGVHNDALIVAGGANFPVAPSEDLWEVPKVWHDDAWVLVKGEAEGEYTWLDGFKLDRPVAYGSCVSIDAGVVCIGGNNADVAFAEVYLLSWDAQKKALTQTPLPPLPRACAFGAAAKIGNVVYVAGGQSGTGLDSAMTNFWRMDLSKFGEEDADLKWETLPAWPGPARALNLTVAQNNGRDDCIYVISGRRQDPAVEGIAGMVPMRDVYEFNPKHYDPDVFDAATGQYNAAADDDQPWRKRGDAPEPMMAGTAMPVGLAHVFVLGYANGEGLKNIVADESYAKRHPGFEHKAWAYHTLTDVWFDAGETAGNQVTTPATQWGDAMIVASGEIKPRIRTNKIWRITPISTVKPFGSINTTVLVVYLLAMVGVGVLFMFKNKDTDDYFRGGQNIPWWAAACSIFATMLSSLTYTGLPAFVYGNDWVYGMGVFMIVATAPIAIYIAMPFFRQIDATSAYEYLSKRFNLPVRLIGSGMFTIFHISRMGIVMALTALALSVAVPELQTWQCVLIMGVLCLIYCTLGGIEAVIWTDTIQTVVLMVGAVVCFIYMINGIDGGIGGFIDAGMAESKFKAIHWNFGLDSYTTVAIWVIIIGGLGQNIASYSADQAVVQRYMTTATPKLAARSIWTNAIMTVPGIVVFCSIGTALYVFYKANPTELDPTLAKADQIFPLFIATQLPAGVAGLIIAGIFAAAQSTVSTSMNSTATTIVTDFMRPFNICKSEKGYLTAARFFTFLMGVLGTLTGLLFISPEVRELLVVYFKVIGMFMGLLAGLFALGMFSRRANGPGAFVGVIGSFILMAIVWNFTKTNGYIYATITILGCFVIGWVASFVLPAAAKDIDGLTIYTMKRTDEAARTGAGGDN